MHGDHVEARAVAHHDHRSARAADERERILGRFGRWRDPQVGEAAGGAARGLVRERRNHLNLVGEHEVRNPAFEERVLARERHQLRVVRTFVHRAREHRHVGEGRIQIDVLERAAPQDLRRDLARQRKHG